MNDAGCVECVSTRRRRAARAALRAFAAESGIANVIGYEATCEKCGETFNPNGDEDVVDRNGLALFEHYQTADEVECGGFGPLTGAWGTGAR